MPAPLALWGLGALGTGLAAVAPTLVKHGPRVAQFGRGALERALVRMPRAAHLAEREDIRMPLAVTAGDIAAPLGEAKQLPTPGGVRFTPVREAPIFSPAALERARDRAAARTPMPEREAIPAPSQPVTPAPVAPAPVAPAPVAPAPVAAERPPTPIERMPAVPAPIAPAPAVRAPVLTPAAAPTPSPLPPAPALPGGGVGIGPARAIPTPAALPPTPVMPGEIFQPRQPVGDPLGRFEAMIRALQAQQGGLARHVPMPLAGAMPFGPSPLAGEALRRLRERELRGRV